MYLTILGCILGMGLPVSAIAQDRDDLTVINESETAICEFYIAPETESDSGGVDYFFANALGCIAPGDEISFRYNAPDECYVVIRAIDDTGSMVFFASHNVCENTTVVVYGDALPLEPKVTVEEGEDNTMPEVVEGHLGYLEIINTSDQQLSQMYVQSLGGGREPQVYQVGEDGNCLDPDMIYIIEYDLDIEECEVRLSVETEFLDVLYDRVYDLCESSEVLVAD